MHDASTKLRTAFAQLLDEGAAVDDVAVRSLCARAGVAPSSFARSYGTKRALSWELLELTWFPAADGAAADDFVSSFFDVAVSRRSRLRALHAEVGRLRPRPPRALVEKHGALVHAAHLCACGVALTDGAPPAEEVRAELLRLLSAPRRPVRVARPETSPFAGLPPILRAVLEGSARVVADDGVAGATVRRIARVAGVGTGTLYDHFKGRAELLEGLFDHFFRFAHEQLGSAQIEEGASVDDAVATLLAVPAGLQRFTPLLRALLGADELPHAVPLLLPQKAVVDAIARVAGDGLPAGSMDTASWIAAFAGGAIFVDVDPEELAALFVAMFEPRTRDRVERIQM